MRDAQPGAIYLKDYRRPAYLINRTELHFELDEDERACHFAPAPAALVRSWR